jgi:hypothetical protein
VVAVSLSISERNVIEWQPKARGLPQLKQAFQARLASGNQFEKFHWILILLLKIRWEPELEGLQGPNHVDL